MHTFCSTLNMHQPTINITKTKNMQNMKIIFNEGIIWMKSTLGCWIKLIEMIWIWGKHFILYEPIFNYHWNSFSLEGAYGFPFFNFHFSNSMQIQLEFSQLWWLKTNRITLNWLQNHWHLTNCTIKQRVVTVPVVIICDFRFHGAWKIKINQCTKCSQNQNESDLF